jgi:hypothetical protein
MPDSYQGPVRIIGDDGILLTTGTAALEMDPAQASWNGSLETLRGTAVAGKALVVELEIPNGDRGRAQLIPLGETGDRSTSSVIGLGAAPF